jgi:hypothetical protein
MESIISRTEISNDELSRTDRFEMTEAFRINSKKKQRRGLMISYANSLHCKNKDKSLMKELTKSDHKHE